MKRIFAQARKELAQVRRDRLVLFLALVLPQILLALFGTALSLTVTDVPIVIQDLDQTAFSRAYSDAWRQTLTFRVVELGSDSQPIDALDSGDARAAIIIPENFERDAIRGVPAEIQILVDATDANTANVLRGNAFGVTANFARSQRSGAAPAIRPETRLWYNPGRDSKRFVGPGAFAVMFALFPPLLAALALSREGEQKTILQVYASSISAHEYLIGKTVAFWLVAVAQWMIGVAVLRFMFGIWFVADPTPLLVGTVAYLFCCVSFGVMVGAAIPNQAAAIQLVQIVGFLLSFLLSGLIFPISNIPAALRWIALFVPARYYIELSRDAFVRGAGWSAMWHVPIVLSAIGLVFFLVAWKRMRRMQVAA